MPITDPTDIASCICWLDGALGVTLTSGKVSTWADQTSHGNNWNQTTAGNRPTVATADLNGLDTIAFAAASSQFLSGPNLFNALTEGELVIIFKQNNDPPTSGIGGLMKFGNSGNSSHYPYTDGNFYDDFGSSSRFSIGNPSDSFATTYRVYAVRSAASDWAVRIDEKVFYRNLTNTVSWYSAPTLGQSVGAYFDGKIAAVYAFNTRLTYAEWQDLTAYIHSRFGILTGSATTPVGTAPSYGSELLAWFKADAGLTYGSLGDISAWADQSGNGHTATPPTTGKRPFIGKGGLNGRTAIRFIEANPSYFQLGDIFNGLTAVEGMIVFVADADPPGGDNYASVWRNDTTSSPYMPAGDGSVYEAWGSSARVNFSKAGKSLATPRFYNVWSASGDYAVNMDTTSLYTSASNTVGRRTVPIIGGNESDAYLTGHIAEVVFFNRKLTASERGQWRDYLSDRWGLALTPSGYSSSPSAGPIFRLAGFVGM